MLLFYIHTAQHADGLHSPVLAAKTSFTSFCCVPTPCSQSTCISGSADCAVTPTVLGCFEEPWVVAQSLFSALRWADTANAEVVIVEGVLETGEGLAVLNRVRKAASCVLQLRNSQ